MEEIKEIGIDKIDDPVNAMRTEVRDESLFDLADNIKQNGLINPITVRPVGDRYEVVAGHRRFSACKVNGMVVIKCVVRELDDKKAFAVMAAENLERKDVDLLDESRFIREYMEKTGADVKETAIALRRSVPYVETRLSIGEMPEYMQQFLKNGQIKLGVALALVQIPNEKIRKLWTEDAVKNGTSVATAEYQKSDYFINRETYDRVVAENSDAGASIIPKVQMFRCAIDDKEYDTRLCRAVIISEENYPYFLEFVRLYRLESAKTGLAPGE